jgi:hypothetical protein
VTTQRRSQGHYVPQLVERVVAGNAANPSRSIPLKGWMVGNPSMEFTRDANPYFSFMAGHAIIDGADFVAANATCAGNFVSNPDPSCIQAAEQLRNQTIGINPYNVVGSCNGKPSLNGGCFTSAAAANVEDLGQTFVPCVDVTPSVTYFHQDSVRAALHVSSSALPWDVCSAVVKYVQYAPTVAPIYEQLSPQMRVLVYSGDVDSCVPFVGTQSQVDLLGFPVIPGKGWESWMVASQIAGFCRTYDVGPKGALAWCSVRGAGHMVPTFKPAQALALFECFVRDDCSGP